MRLRRKERGWEDNFPPAVEIIDSLNPKEILLDHFDDTFPPITEPVDLCPVLQKYQGKIEVMQLNRTELR